MKACGFRFGHRLTFVPYWITSHQQYLQDSHLRNLSWSEHLLDRLTTFQSIYLITTLCCQYLKFNFCTMKTRLHSPLCHSVSARNLHQDAHGLGWCHSLPAGVVCIGCIGCSKSLFVRIHEFKTVYWTKRPAVAWIQKQSHDNLIGCIRTYGASWFSCATSWSFSEWDPAFHTRAKLDADLLQMSMLRDAARCCDHRYLKPPLSMF